MEDKKKKVKTHSNTKFLPIFNGRNKKTLNSKSLNLNFFFESKIVEIYQENHSFFGFLEFIDWVSSNAKFVFSSFSSFFFNLESF